MSNWNYRQLEERYVELNHPRIVAMRILECEREIDKLRALNGIIENKLIDAYDKLKQFGYVEGEPENE